ncbi:MAG: type II toxin-antitoxin system RelE family toxin [Candidatus Dormibacteraceae bacterium]
MRWRGRSACEQLGPARGRVGPESPQRVGHARQTSRPAHLRSGRSVAQRSPPHGARALVGHPAFWRIRVGDFRVVYAIGSAPATITVLRVAHRSGVYRNL